MVNVTIKKPMLSGTLKDLSSIVYPVWCTEKLDGIRCLIVNGKAVSRTFKDIPNLYIHSILEKVAVEGMDGELILKGKPFSEVSSAVMSRDGKPDFCYQVFDYCTDPKEAYSSRMNNLSKLPVIPHIEYLLPTVVKNENELLRFEEKCLIDGFEGAMLRAPDSPYKFGRSTEREQYLLKLKRFTDGEAVIVDVFEKMSNQNEEFIDELGYSKRSSHKEGKVGAGTLGGFKVKDLKSKVEFGVGSGFDDALRKKIWKNKKEYIGKMIKYKSQKSGEKEKPRFPVFIGFRNKQDM